MTSVAQQAGAVGLAAQRRLVLPSSGCGIEQPRFFLRNEHHRQPARLLDEVGVFDDIATPERDPEEEPQRRYGLVGWSVHQRRSSPDAADSDGRPQLAISGDRPRKAAKFLTRCT